MAKMNCNGSTRALNRSILNIDISVIEDVHLDDLDVLDTLKIL